MNAHPRWKKLLADLWQNKTRTLLVALSIAIGIFSVGFVATTYLILKSDIPADYFTANPHAAILFTAPFDKGLLNRLEKVNGVAQVEGRSSISAKLEARDGSIYPIQITRYPDLSETKIDQLRLETGASRLGRHEIFLERQVASKLGCQVGDVLRVTLKNGSEKELTIAGTVQAVNGTHFLYTKIADAYTNANTLAWLDGPELYTQLVFTVEPQVQSKTEIRDIATALADEFRSRNLSVDYTEVANPGQTPNQTILDAMLALMAILGVLSLVLSAVLVYNTISAVMNAQIRQIGVMKALGATFGQLAGLYMALVLAFGVIALILAIPLSAAGAYGLCWMISQMMNVNLAPFQIPIPAFLLQIAIGIGIPALGALLPVIHGARLTVREAISNYGIAAKSKADWFDHLLENIRGLPRPLMLSLRNTFRRKSRLVLTLVMLTLGGAIFVSVFGLRDSIYQVLDQTFAYSLSDVNVRLSDRYSVSKLQMELQDIPGIASMEGWGHEMADVLETADSETGDSVEIQAPPSGSKLIQPVITDGRWLVAGDQNALVVGNAYIKMRPLTKIGDTVQVRIGRKVFPFTIIGVYEMAGTPNSPIVYTTAEHLDKITHRGGQVDRLRIVTDSPSPTRQREVQRAVEMQLKAHHMDATVETGSDVITSQSAPVSILITLLLVMAMLIALVGGLGLMGTMSMNVLERTREIGVMRSIGAVNATIFQLVIVEGLLVGLISWGLGALLSLPITRLLDRGVGVALLNVPLKFSFSLQGLTIWFAVVVILSILASLLPARSAVRLTIRDVLAYE